MNPKPITFSLTILFLLGCLVVVPISKTAAQPYVDIVSARLAKSPDIGFTPKAKRATTLDYFNVSTTFPFFLENKKDAIILSPFFERWSSKVEGITIGGQFHYGVALPVSLLTTISNSNWTLLTTGIIRMNDRDINFDSRWRFGGAIIAANHLKDNNLTYKIGFYVNSEFFGLFIVPLVGIDWHINEKTNLFGVLPASLTLEHQLSSHFYTGATFRTFTNSYRDSAQNYFRIDENQLGVYVDYYINKHIVLNIEAGHSILRKIRSGVKHETPYNWNACNNPYFKFMIAYRIRTR
ncbi:MAG: hypothetical protein JST75_19960 [Bacteroidetes bacterium]|nr:hypothetical protein [Bacteroidota bacterium]